jgi:tetratricopeptide (TPR) repeat protein
MGDDERGSQNLDAVRPPAPDTVDAAEDGSALMFRAESKPIESPPSSPRLPVAEVDGENRAYVPTVPPMRATHSQALRPTGATAVHGARVGRWLLVILFGALVSLVAVWSHYRTADPAQNVPGKSAADLERHLQSAGEALRVGDLNQAHEHLQVSQSLGARDTRWQILTARYDIVRADMNWLAVRLADPNDTSRVESLKRELSENLEQSIKALNLVEHLANAETEIVAARLDAQRISGELSKAHEAAVPLEGTNLPPDLAYALASVELLQPSPRYKEVFDWLGQARAKDSGLGRAPVMLVLACVAGNRLESARAEVQRLKLAQRSHPLLAEIEAFVRRAADQAAAAEQAATPDAGTPAAAEAGEAEAIAEVTREGDFRLRLRRAVESLGRGELTRAERLFRSVLSERPKDTEALTGLGDVARRRGNTANAISYYERVLSSNGQYLPALSALADVKWKTGDKAGAAALYHRIVDQVGESPGYGQSASQRLRELSESSSPKSNSPSESEKPAAPEPKPAAASPNIDTTDLPGKSQ